jgi:heptaprenyl diphosphate synthase
VKCITFYHMWFKHFRDRGTDKLTDNWQLVNNELALVELHLRQMVDGAGPEIKTVGIYITESAGKRIRPALFLIAAYNEKKTLNDYIDIAAALELLHTASLLHDDVIDQASTRRGKVTAHLKWSNKIAVLSGDYVLSRVFEMLVDYGNWRLMDVIVKIVKNLAEGEVQQAFATYNSPNLEQSYFEWIGKKSASFFAGCCEAGSLVAGEGVAEQKLWSKFGYNLGIAFQLIDDFLDYNARGESIGKPVNGDLNNRVLTLPLIRALQSDQNDIQTHLINYMKQDKDDNSNFDQAVKAVLLSDGLDYTLKKAEEYADEAVKIAGKVAQNCPEKAEVLADLTRSLLMRNK